MNAYTGVSASCWGMILAEMLRPLSFPGHSAIGYSIMPIRRQLR
jgi:hypothetical protein